MQTEYLQCKLGTVKRQILAKPNCFVAYFAPLQFTKSFFFFRVPPSETARRWGKRKAVALNSSPHTGKERRWNTHFSVNEASSSVYNFYMYLSRIFERRRRSKARRQRYNVRLLEFQISNLATTHQQIDNLRFSAGKISRWLSHLSKIGATGYRGPDRPTRSPIRSWHNAALWQGNCSRKQQVAFQPIESHIKPSP